MPHKKNSYQDLLKNNREWASKQTEKENNFFDEMSKHQDPKFFFIGCSDSRVPLTSLTESEAGEIFVQRNIANQVNLTDFNTLSAIEFAVISLKVEHIIVLGHYKCGGIHVAVDGVEGEELVENWVSSINDLYHFHKKELELIPNEQHRYDKLSELNVIAQLKNLLRTPIMQRSFRNDHYVAIHGWIFDIYTGLLKELELPFEVWIEQELLPADYEEVVKIRFQ